MKTKLEQEIMADVQRLIEDIRCCSTLDSLRYLRQMADHLGDKLFAYESLQEHEVKGGDAE